MKNISLLLLALLLIGCEATKTITETETQYIKEYIEVTPTANTVYSDNGNRVKFLYPTGNVKVKEITYAAIDYEEIVLFIEDSSLVNDIKIKTKDASKYFVIVDDNNTTYNALCKSGTDTEHTIYLNRTNAQIDKVTGNYIEVYINDILYKHYDMIDFKRTE